MGGDQRAAVGGTTEARRCPLFSSSFRRGRQRAPRRWRCPQWAAGRSATPPHPAPRCPHLGPLPERAGRPIVQLEGGGNAKGLCGALHVVDLGLLVVSKRVPVQVVDVRLQGAQLCMWGTQQRCRHASHACRSEKPLAEKPATRRPALPRRHWSLWGPGQVQSDPSEHSRRGTGHAALCCAMLRRTVLRHATPHCAILRCGAPDYCHPGMLPLTMSIAFSNTPAWLHSNAISP